MTKEVTCIRCEKNRIVRSYNRLTPEFCRSCSLLKAHEENYKGQDVIFVSHKSGTRASQRVVKFRSFCPKCKKDRGYIFKKYVNTLCASCSHKKSYRESLNINDNYGFIRTYHETPNQGVVCVRSSYEAFYLEYLNKNEIDYLYEPEPIIFNDNSTYLPDFYLLKQDKYIELKGFEYEKCKEITEKLRIERPDINRITLKLNDLKELGYSPSRYRKSFKLNINGEYWKFNLLSPNSYIRKHGKDSDAITDTSKKEVDFQTGSITSEIIIHELYHVYYATLSLNSTTKLTADDIEEINAECISKHLFKMLYESFLIQKNLLNICINRFNINLNEEFLEFSDIVPKLKRFKSLKYFTE